VGRVPATLIVTVRNEAESIDALLDSLLRGRRAPDEMVVADGGSSDGTLERLRARAADEPRLRVLDGPGNRSVGRNAAIRAARHDVIACTDAGVEVEPTWFERIVAPFEADPAVDVVAGFYRPIARTPFERAAGVVSAPALAEVDPERFLPSTRSVAFRRAAWERAGGFDEALAHNEDTPFALAMKGAGCRFAFAPEARVQAWFYGTIAIKYGIAVALLLLGTVYPVAWTALAAGVALFVLQQARRGFGRIGIVEALVGVPALKIVYDAAYLGGYVRGRLARR
jgi:glycosyltransferase involved in cell wall biosynthesis